MRKYDYIIVGAGIAGLTIAYKLLQQNKSILLIERDHRVGGLAKSFYYQYDNKPFIFDLGPKRFHTYNHIIREFILEILQKNYIEIKRKSAVYLFNQYFNWPLIPSDILKLPLYIQIQVIKDLALKFFKRYEHDKNDKIFKTYIIHTYGKTLYEHFFKGYTEKFLKIPPEQIHSDWAKTGIERSIIDKKMLMRKTAKTEI